MLIPATPVRRVFQNQPREQKNVLRRPFPFMSGKQAVFSCAREALFYGIRLLDYRPNNIHVPAFCCRSVLSPFEQLGLKIKFYDVGKRLEPIIDKAVFTIGDIFLLVHYFGIPQDTISINQMCQESGMLLVEDCAHTLPDPEAEHTMGSIGAFSIYSLRKQLPVPDGGVLIINNLQIGEHIADLVLPRLRRVSTKRWLVTNLDFVAFTIGFPNTLILKDILRHIIGSGDDFFQKDLRDGAVPEISPVTLRVLSTIDFTEIVRVRRKNYCRLADYLSGSRGVTTPFQSLPDGAVPLAFPVMVDGADSVCTFMRKKGISAGRWPGSDLPESIPWSDFPGASSWIKSLILLPSHQDINDIYLEKIAHIFKKSLS